MIKMKIVNNLSKIRKIMKNQKKVKRRTNRIVKRVSKLEHKVEELSKNKDKKLIKVDIERISVRLIICVLAMVLFYIPHENGFDPKLKLKLTLFFVASVVLYKLIKSILKIDKKKHCIILLFYMFYITGWISIFCILGEIILKLGHNIPVKYNIFNYTEHYMPLLIMISSVGSVFLPPKQMRYDEEIFRKIVFINKQLLLAITISAFFYFNLTPENISNGLIMGCLFSIYPLTFMYNFFEFWNIKKDKKEEIYCLR